MIADHEQPYLLRCIELAKEALDAGDQPFGSVLVNAEGLIIAEDRNRIADGDNTQHPEFALARWAAKHLTADERAQATVYTSGEHCAMCAAAHAWVGLGRIVYVSSTTQLVSWLDEFNAPPAPVKPLAINQVAPQVKVAGPALNLSSQVYQLHKEYYARVLT